MKTLPTIAIAMLLLVIAAATPASAEPASVLLQEGLYAEEIEGDLDAAIKIYEKIVAQAEQTQQAAAMAMYRIGMCRLKKGDKTQAAGQFRQLVEKFPGQEALVAKARQQIAKIKPEAVAHFGPVIERVISSEDSGKGFFYDLDAGKPVSPPSGLIRSSPPQEVMAWEREKGIDLVNDREMLGLTDIVAVEVSSRLWDSGAPAEISDALKNASSKRMLVTSPNTYYAFKTREGGSGILRIFDITGKDLRFRYKMLQGAASSAQLKGSLYEHLPNDVLTHVAGKYGSISAEAIAKGLFSNSHIYFVEADMTLRMGGMNYYRTSSGLPAGDRIHLSITSYPYQTLYDIVGREMNVEIVLDGDTYHIYWTPSEPIPPGQMFYYGWSKNEARRLSRARNLSSAEGAATYALIMQNQFGPRCIETFFAVVPAGMEIIDKTEDYTAKETVGGFDIYYWTKEVPPNTDNRIDLAITPPATGETMFGPVQTAAIYDFDHPTTEDKHCAIDLDKDITAGIPTAIRSKNTKYMMMYLADEGADVTVEFHGDIEDKKRIALRLRGLDMVIEGPLTEAWDELSPDQLQAMVDLKKPSPISSFGVDGGRDPAKRYVYAFATREGAMGLLQIFSADDKERKIELRYKKLTNVPVPSGVAGQWTRRRAESVRRLKLIGTFLHMYADDHAGVLPDTHWKLRPYVGNPELFEWIDMNVKYLGRGKTSDFKEPYTSVLAYDKTLMAQGRGTNVLFLDAHVEFIAADELKARGVPADAESDEAAASPSAAAEMLPALKGLMVGVSEAIENNDSDTAVALLEKLIADSKKLARSLKGTSAEAGVTSGIGTLEMLREALANKQMDRAKSLLSALNQMGPGLEDIVKEQATKQQKPKSPIDLRTPEATIKSFVKAVYCGNLEAAGACVSKDGHDYDEFKEMLATESNHPFQAMLKAMDDSVPIEITSKSVKDGKCKISWYLTLGRVYYFGETKMTKGMRQEFSSYLELVGDEWLIRDI